MKKELLKGSKKNLKRISIAFGVTFILQVLLSFLIPQGNEVALIVAYAILGGGVGIIASNYNVVWGTILALFLVIGAFNLYYGGPGIMALNLGSWIIIAFTLMILSGVLTHAFFKDLRKEMKRLK